jgi:hypothetical protein
MADIVTPSAGLDASNSEASAPSAIRLLLAIAVAAGLSWSILFVLIGVAYELQSYGDGSIFSYSIAVEDAWAFHWHNIPTRIFAYLFSMLPAEGYVHLTRDASGGIALYGLLFFVVQLLGLLATFAADRSKGRITTAYACGSTACLCPLVFGFPTETWMAHALFWPTLALCHYGSRGAGGTAAVFAALLALVFTYDGAIGFAIVIVMTLLLRGMWNRSFLRAAGAFAAVMLIWATVKASARPDEYVAVVLARAAWHVFDPTILTDHIVLVLFGALAGYAIACAILRQFGSTHAFAYAAVIVATILAANWIRFDHTLHAENRYYMRTVLLVAIPALGVLAAAYASRADGELISLSGSLSWLLAALTRSVSTRFIAGALVLIVLIHAVETAKFVTAWAHYKDAVRALATGADSDPSLGDPNFVSAARIGADLNRLSWFSTTHFLSVLVAPDFKPARLVVDPSANYFWLTCGLARANENAPRAIPVESRRVVRIHACLHRP